MAEHLTIPGALEWDTVERHSIATLRYAGGKEHEVKYVSEVAYDALVAELKAIKESVEGYESPEHAAQVADSLSYEVGMLKQRLTFAEQRVETLTVFAQQIARQQAEPYFSKLAKAALKPAGEQP